jgi:prefoldin subunit 5
VASIPVTAEARATYFQAVSEELQRQIEELRGQIATLQREASVKSLQTSISKLCDSTHAPKTDEKGVMVCEPKPVPPAAEPAKEK